MRWLGYVGLAVIAVSAIVFSLSFMQYSEYQQILDENERRAEECYATATGYAAAMCGKGGALTFANLSSEVDFVYQTMMISAIFIGIGASIFVIGYKKQSRRLTLVTTGIVVAGVVIGWLVLVYGGIVCLTDVVYC